MSLVLADGGVADVDAVEFMGRFAVHEREHVERQTPAWALAA
ncbi:MAG: hypothetical protein R3E45_06710 [Rhodocyclaceae bacterium]